MTDKDLQFDINHFRPDRFLEGTATWSNPFTAGEQSNAAGSVVRATTLA